MNIWEELRDTGRPVAVIDPSMTGLYLMIEGPDHPLQEVPLYTKSEEWPKTLVGRLKRFRSITDSIAERLRAAKPCLLAIEGYAFSMGGKGRPGRVVSLGELGGIMRDHIVGYSDVSCEVTPGTVKLSATGKGSANKVQVASHCAARYGRTFRDDNEADCFALLRLCMASVGYDQPTTEFQRKAIATVRALIQQEAS